MMNKNRLVRSVIRLLVEKMGHVNTRAGRGWGTSSPEIVKSDRMMLGHVNNVDDLSSDESNGPVKVSRAFNKAN